MFRILVAEDSFALANLLEILLGNAGFEVDLHRTGNSASKAVENQSYDLILLDQQIPHMTGVEIIEQIRSAGPNKETPAFLCTAKAHELDLQHIHETLKVIEVFEKPFSPKGLVQRLKETVVDMGGVSATSGN